ncbi:MAG: hypothetical protein WBO06_05350 [Gammaproteobacteria bacterium]
MFSGGALERLSIFALGIMPYISASIIMNLLSVTVPSLEQLKKEGGEAGRHKITQYTRYGTVALASPAIMTGLILAVARAAGEVAPLMLVGVVKLAPSLPLDGNFPFLHLDRKFMHLGFHIYDVGFQSPNVEAARPLVYATSFLLVVVIVTLNLTAINLRNKLREKYRALDG